MSISVYSKRYSVALLVSAVVLTWPVAATAQSLYATTNSGHLYRITSDGSYSLINATVTYPGALTVDNAGNVFVGDQSDGTIYKISPNGTKTAYATVTADNFPGIAFDATGNLFLAETSRHDIREIAPNGAQTIFASGLGQIESLAIDATGNLYDVNSHGDIDIISPSGVVSLFDNITEATTVGVDSQDNMIITRFHRNDVLFAPQVGFVSTLSSGIDNPYGVAIDLADAAYVSESYGDNIYKIDTFGARTTFATLPEPAAYLAFGPDYHPSTTPEPGSWAMLLSGLCSAAGIWRRRRLYNAL